MTILRLPSPWKSSKISNRIVLDYFHWRGKGGVDERPCFQLVVVIFV